MARTSVSTTATSRIDVARLRLAIVRLARRQRQQSGTGLTSSLQSALAVIDLHGPLTLGALATLEQISPPTTTRLVAVNREILTLEHQAGLVPAAPHRPATAVPGLGR